MAISEVVNYLLIFIGGFGVGMATTGFLVAKHLKKIYNFLT